jgi:aryl-alcohol dehydrogenase-like predicted oxidoreductase
LEYISIQGLNKRVSRLVMGTAHMQESNKERIIPMLDTYVARGGNTLDTAENYRASETILGEWMQERGNREQLVIQTKGAHPYERSRVTPGDITADLLGSLERLRTDYADIYLLHRDDPSVPVVPIVDCLNKHIEAGRIRTIGASNWSWERLEEANDYAEKHGLQGFAVSSTNLSLAKAKEPMWAGCVSADEKTGRWHEARQLPLIAWAAQAGGFFTGRFSPEDRSHADMVRVYYSDDNWERYRRAKRLAEEKGVNPMQVAFAYVLHQPYPTCGIIGSQMLPELEDNLAATELSLTAEEVVWLDLR